ncbi:MAG: efflux RND transporter periplasmic adaptor subunit [Treponema sp.]|nr:efflux RND transporter periplasmic adaptor subunit [Treponema sp.]MBR6913974.1 efflux RND transporter periplasmic adaptor subunit [Treponema sp.]
MIRNTKIQLILLIVAFVSAFSSCTKENANEAHSPTQDSPAQKVSVKAEKLTRSTMRTYVELNGSIVAKNSVQVYPNIAGKIVGSKVNLGQTVKKGDVLVFVDPSSPGEQFTLSQVVSPIDGSVISIPPKNGLKVSTDTAVLTIGDLSSLEVKTYLPEKYFGSLKIGQKAEIRVEAWPQEHFLATVQNISPVVDEASRTVETILRFDERDKRITAGMFSKIKLYLSEYENVLSIPENAVAERNGKRVIFTVGADGKAQSHKITEGISVDGRIQILSGADEGEIVITEGVSSVQDGMEVSIISE